MARLAGFEPATYGLEVRCSIQLSYKRNSKYCRKWSGKRDSNPRPTAWKAVALPTELFPHCSTILAFPMVGAKGFEPSTPCSQSRCANQTALRPELSSKVPKSIDNLVELGGIEPPASSVRRKRAPAALQPLPRVTATILELERIVVKTTKNSDEEQPAYYPGNVSGSENFSMRPRTFGFRIDMSSEQEGDRVLQKGVFQCPCSRSCSTISLIPSRAVFWAKDAPQ